MEVVARNVGSYSACKLPGDFYLSEPNEAGNRRLSFLCPCGCGDLCGIQVRDDGQRTASAWAWDRDEERPTVDPSIAINGEHWHGYLKQGVFKK